MKFVVLHMNSNKIPVIPGKFQIARHIYRLNLVFDAWTFQSKPINIFIMV